MAMEEPAEQGAAPNADMRPKAFYRREHPELFSDSSVTYEMPLSEELFDLQMELLSTHKKQSEFEKFIVAVAGRLITPNIKPQTGPDGGGDGKVDAETYEVSSGVSDKWFSEEAGAAGPEKWAFAISCKKQWRPKAESDVQKIVDTGRGYARILFFSNQNIKSDLLHKVEDQLSRQFGIKVELFDRSWCMKAVFRDGCLDIALKELGFSDEYKKRTVHIGPLDRERNERLQEIEKDILRPVDGLDTEYVELLEEACLLSRCLERPRTETEGRFRRAMDECKRHGTNQQMFNIVYNHAWTCFFWFEAPEATYRDYFALKQQLLDDCSVYRLERVTNLVDILGSGAVQDLFDRSKIRPEQDFFYGGRYEATLAADANRKSSYLFLRLRRAENALGMHLATKQPVEEDICTLRTLLDEASSNLEISFETIYTILGKLSDLAEDNPDFDRFIDELADKIALQRSEVEAAKVRLSRAEKYYESKQWKKVIGHLGFCVFAFEKEECFPELIESSILMGDALWHLQLPYSAEAFLIKACCFLIKEFRRMGIVPRALVKALGQLCEIELMLGRLVMYLNWHELSMVMARYAQMDETPEFIQKRHLEDGGWACRFATIDVSKPIFSTLPDMLLRHGLWISSEYLKHSLGHSDSVDPEASPVMACLSDSSLQQKQPIFEQFLCDLNISQSGPAHLETSVNNFTFRVEYPNDCTLQQVAETFLASMESLMATYDEFEVLAIHSDICIQIVLTDGETELQPLQEPEHYEFRINQSTFSPEQFWKAIVHFIALLFSRNAQTQINLAELLERKQNGERMMDRVSVLLHTDAAMPVVLGNPFKYKIDDWGKETDKVYAFQGIIVPRPHVEYRNRLQNQCQTFLVNRDLRLWDDAGWEGCAVYADAFVPFTFGLVFSNEEKGRAIFSEWKQKDSEGKPSIRIIVVKGIDAEHPCWYRVCILPDVPMNDTKDGAMFACWTRCKTMAPPTNTNLSILEREWRRSGHCRIAPMFIDANRQWKPLVDFSLSFDFSRITIIDAYQIGVDSGLTFSLLPDDNPVIPESWKTDAPVLKALAQLKEIGQRKGTRGPETSAFARTP